MDRRRFLSLKSDRRLDVSCEQLFMRSVDAHGRSLEPELANEWDAWQPGEPEAAYERRTVEDVFDALDRELRTVDVLHVTDTQWLVGDVRREFDRVLTAFRARGGTVEIDG